MAVPIWLSVTEVIETDREGMAHYLVRVPTGTLKLKRLGKASVPVWARLPARYAGIGHGSPSTVFHRLGV